jgi:hypothetical protein
MHENSYQIDHDLSDQNVEQNNGRKCYTEAVHPLKAFYRFKRVEHLLLIDQEASHENNTCSKQSVHLLGESILIDCQHVISHLSEELIRQEHHDHCL